MTANYHIDLFDGVVTFRWTVTFNGSVIGSGNAQTADMALEAAQHCIDVHASGDDFAWMVAA